MAFSTKLFNLPIRINPFVSRNEYNVVTYGTPVIAYGREETSLEYRRENFTELGITHTIIYAYSPRYMPTIEDTATLQSGAVYPILNILSNRNDRGKVEFYTIILGDRR